MNAAASGKVPAPEERISSWVNARELGVTIQGFPSYTPLCYAPRAPPELGLFRTD